MACGILVPQPGIKPAPPAGEVRSLNHWTTREVPENGFFVFYKFIYLFLAVLGLRCCVRAFSICSEWELLCVAVRGLLIAVASLVVEHGL